MAIWIAGTFIKVGFYHYVVALSTAQWLNLSDYRLLALPFGLLITLFGIWLVPNFSELSHFLAVTLPFAGGLFFVAIPLILFMVAVLRNKNSDSF